MPQNPVIGAVRLPYSGPIVEKVRELQDSGPSVFEPTTHKLARWLANLVPTDGDVSDFINPMSAPAGVAVSAFMKAGGGGKLARQAATEKNLGDLVKRLLDVGAPQKEITEALEFAKSRPRVMGHMGVSQELPKGMAIGSNEPVGGGFSRIRLSPGVTMGDGINENISMIKPKHFGSTIAHEMTHAAQNVSLKDKLTPLYLQGNKEFGYLDNPFEQGARRVQEKHFPGTAQAPVYQSPQTTKKMHDWLRQGSQNDPLAQLVEKISGVKF